MASIKFGCSLQKQNLLESFLHHGMFDIIFCRNVAIYFTVACRQDLFARLANQLNPDGVLVIGSTESLFGVCDRFERLEASGTFYYGLKA
jgi:chemotaxis protein methyltransferase CheR